MRNSINRIYSRTVTRTIANLDRAAQIEYNWETEIEYSWEIEIGYSWLIEQNSE